MNKNKESLFINWLQGSLFLIAAAFWFVTPFITVRLAAFAGTLTFAVLLIAPRLLKWQKMQRWHGKLLTIARNSKWMGVWTALWFMLHAASGFMSHLQGSTAHLLHPAVFLGVVSLIVFTMVLGISNKWSYHHVKWWKHLNMAVWLVVPLGFTHALLAASHYLHSTPLPSALIFFPLMMLVGLLAQLEKEPGYFAPHRIGLLCAGSLIGIVATWWSFAL